MRVMGEKVDLSSLVPLPEAAKLADITEAWMRRLARTGAIKAVRIGKYWLVDKREAAAFERHPSMGRPRKKR